MATTSGKPPIDPATGGAFALSGRVVTMNAARAIARHLAAYPSEYATAQTAWISDVLSVAQATLELELSSAKEICVQGPVAMKYLPPPQRAIPAYPRCSA